MVQSSSPPIRIVRLSHMRYQHADLAKAKAFLEDFGMHVAYEENDTLYFAGKGPDPYVYVASSGAESKYLGGTFLVETKDDLVRASELIPGASKLLPTGPAGGFLVTFSDPDGIPCNLVWGLQEREISQAEEHKVANYPREKPRKGEFVRFKQQPCEVFKLGHFGLLISDFDRTFDFYTKYFNLKPTDILRAPDWRHVAAFMHIDREEEWTDHHSFFFSLSHRIGTHHSSFEVDNPDVQAIGHDWLVAKGYDPAWGVGRHILGSQVFDYWFTPDDFLVEHYSDGDLVNCHTETGYLEASNEALAIWGPAVPDTFHAAINPAKKQTA